MSADFGERVDVLVNQGKGLVGERRVVQDPAQECFAVREALAGAAITQLDAAAAPFPPWQGRRGHALVISVSSVPVSPVRGTSVNCPPVTVCASPS